MLGRDVKWLQKLVDILRPDLYETFGRIEIKFSGACYADHTMRLVRDHIRKFDWGHIPEVHDGEFNYDTGEWEGDTPTLKREV